MNAHAEIDQVWPRDGRIRLVGRVHGDVPESAGPEWRLLLVPRDDENHRLRYAASVDGASFEASLPVDDLALDGLPEAVWDLYLTAGDGGDGDDGGGGARLRVGKHLDDITGKKKIFVYPAQSVTSDEDGTVVRPFYTIQDNLSVECLPGDLELREGELPLPEWIA
ncbi:hypothetical protein [Streptomyces sp. JJ36]|uniref:hypothetical protein n=1 Tax=Streptomyces sp. JJ36 TaxID=2736645 RepID=UPI001F3E21C7|nr:hypothetical protein [Streptomyces sp. JJ36]MCF6525106.1 hypothetical protein [Streptomyces sp. JJ36]